MTEKADNHNDCPLSDASCEEYGDPWTYLCSVCNYRDYITVIAWPVYSGDYTNRREGPMLVSVGATEYDTRGPHYEVIYMTGRIEHLTAWPKHWRWRVFNV